MNVSMRPKDDDFDGYTVILLRSIELRGCFGHIWLLCETQISRDGHRTVGVVISNGNEPIDENDASCLSKEKREV